MNSPENETYIELEREVRWWFDSWELFWKEAGKSRKQQLEFMPTPYEIEQRIKDMNWMRDVGFSSNFIDCVMLDDDPSIHKVCFYFFWKNMSSDEIERTFGF